MKTIACALLIGMTVGSFGCSGGARAVPPSVGERAEVVPAAPALASPQPTAPAPVAAATAVTSTPAKVARAARSSERASTKPVGGVVVRRLVVATGVKNREPEGVSTLFRQAEVDRLYAFVEVDNRSGAANEVRVSFEPPDGGAERGDVELRRRREPRVANLGLHARRAPRRLVDGGRARRRRQDPRADAVRDRAVTPTAARSPRRRTPLPGSRSASLRRASRRARRGARG